MSVVDTPVASGPVVIPRDRTWWQKYGTTTTVWLVRLALVVVLLALWEIAADRWIDITFISRPSDIVGRLGDWVEDGSLWTNTWITVQEIVYGFLLGAAAGVLVGFVLASLNFLYRVLDPFMMALYAIPKVALAPLFIVWFGIGMHMKVLLAAATVFFLVFINTAAGVREVDRGLVDGIPAGRAVSCLPTANPSRPPQTELRPHTKPWAHRKPAARPRPQMPIRPARQPAG